MFNKAKIKTVITIIVLVALISVVVIDLNILLSYKANSSCTKPLYRWLLITTIIYNTNLSIQLSSTNSSLYQSIPRIIITIPPYLYGITLYDNINTCIDDTNTIFYDQILLHTTINTIVYIIIVNNICRKLYKDLFYFI